MRFLAGMVNQSAGERGPGRSVAVVDDDAGVRRALDRLLRSAGFAVQTFESAECFLAANPDQWDCLVADVYLSGMSGLDLERRLAGHVLPVILITAHHDAATQEQLRHSRAIAILRKPFDGEALIAAIERGLMPPSAA